MSFVQQYIAYLKHNPHHYWFKRKLFGWGWTPATREGWLTTAIFVALIVWRGVVLGRMPMPTDENVFRFFVEVGAVVVLLVYICYKKGESPRWQWGLPQNDGTGEDAAV